MKTFLSLTLSLLLIPLSTYAQPGALQPPLLDCGMQGSAEIICNTRAPEDFELTPDGNFLIVANYGVGEDFGLDLFELSTKVFTELPLSSAPLTNWGDPACTDSIGEQVGPHGLSLSQRDSGEWQLYVVNHSARESMEMYELLPDGSGWKLVWRGCVFAEEPYNDVAALADGSFVATRPTAIQTEGQNVFDGKPTGNVVSWNSSSGEQVLPGTEIGYPNGVVASDDGRYAYISGWTTSNYHQYDLINQRRVASADFGFMADNLTWTPEGNILAAGVKGIGGNCPQESDTPCIQGFKVAEINPENLALTVVYDSEDRALINGTSVAIEVDDYVYVGSFQGTRMVKLPR